MVFQYFIGLGVLMAKLSVKQADQQLFTVMIPLLTKMSVRLGYTAYVYWPGFDAPIKPDRTRVYVDVQRTELNKAPLGMEADSGFISESEIRVMIYATELKSDHGICTDTADEFVQVFGRRRCGRDMVIKNSRWEDTTESYGRRLFTIVISYEYEAF